MTKWDRLQLGAALFQTCNVGFSIWHRATHAHTWTDTVSLIFGIAVLGFIWSLFFSMLRKG